VGQAEAKDVLQKAIQDSLVMDTHIPVTGDERVPGINSHKRVLN
jgi:hypothetical protein